MMNEDELYIDQSLIDDFFAEYEEAQEEINYVINILDNRYDSDELDGFLDTIYRRVHSIKSNFRMIGEKQQSDIIHFLENIFTSLKHNSGVNVQAVLYLVKVIIEEVRFLTLNKFQQRDVSDVLNRLESDLDVLSGLPESDLEKNLQGFLSSFELQGDYDANFSLDILMEEQKSEVVEPSYVEVSFQKEIDDIIAGNADLTFFRELIEQLESFLPFWHGRSRKILDLLIAMNRARDNRVDEQQLIAAILMHDIGMGFIAPFITHKPFNLDPDEEIIMRDHVHQGKALLSRIPGWQEAARMIASHHENYDGSGYPLGLSGDNICHGARLLAIGDAFWAMTNDRMYVYKKKPVINALMDINKKAGVLYDEQWVTVFNEVLKNS